MASSQTELTDLLIYGIDIKNRRIYFGNLEDTENTTDFTQISVELAVRALHKMASEAPNKPIEIHVSSFGGDPYLMLRLHDEVLACSAQVKFFGGGAIMSAATWLMVACDERYLYPNATVMIHDGSEGYEGKHTDVQINAAESKRLQELLYDIYTNNTRMPKEFWQDVCQRDLYISASEAIMLGMADKIVEPKKRGNLRKLRQAALKKTPDSVCMKDLIKNIYSRINKVKVPKIELNVVHKEPIDHNLIIDDKPVQSLEIEKVPVQINVVEPFKNET